MAQRKANSAFSSNLFAWQRTVKGDRMRPNCGELSVIVFLLKSNINQSCFLFFFIHVFLQMLYAANNPDMLRLKVKSDLQSFNFCTFYNLF